MGSPPLSNLKGEPVTGIKKGPWSAEEDQKLVAYIRRYGIWNWNHMAKPAGLARSGKSCRLRWLNYLRPNVRHGNFTKEEVETIIRWHKVLGNRWSAIAAKLQGRTDNEIKNYWNTCLKKRVAKEDHKPVQAAGLSSHSVRSTLNKTAAKYSNIINESQSQADQINLITDVPPKLGQEYGSPVDYSPPPKFSAKEGADKSSTVENSPAPNTDYAQFHGFWEELSELPVLEDLLMADDFGTTLMVPSGFILPYSLQENLSGEHFFSDLWD